MSNEKTKCCTTENSDCNTVEKNCCSTKENPTMVNNKKKFGLGILLLAITFALASAFTLDDSTQKANCDSNEAECSSSCDTEDSESSCCTK